MSEIPNDLGSAEQAFYGVLESLRGDLDDLGDADEIDWRLPSHDVSIPAPNTIERQDSTSVVAAKWEIPGRDDTVLSLPQFPKIKKGPILRKFGVPHLLEFEHNAKDRTVTRWLGSNHPALAGLSQRSESMGINFDDPFVRFCHFKDGQLMGVHFFAGIDGELVSIFGSKPLAFRRSF